MREVERFIVLEVVDTRWREHLENMDYLREGVHLRAFAQKDPLVEYRAEGHRCSRSSALLIREEVLLLLFHAQIEPHEAEELMQTQDDDGGLRVRARVAGGRGRDRSGGLGGEASARRSTAARRRRAVATQQRVDRAREGRPQRSLLVRLRQEVQEVPRRIAVAPSS